MRPKPWSDHHGGAGGANANQTPTHGSGRVLTSVKKHGSAWADAAPPRPRGATQEGHGAPKQKLRRREGPSQGGSLLLAVAGDSRELAGPARARGPGGQLLSLKWGDLGSRFLYDLLRAPGREGMGSSCVTLGL